ncbi:MAG: HD domain-containing protein [Clostridiales bacterium]|nr:HD domain-containing protein [Clostridiales bacterium]
MVIEMRTEYHKRIPDHVLQCMGRLSKAGFEAWLVGGSVRDFCMGREPTDFDLTTDASPDRLTEIFSDFKLVTAGIKHGTVMVVIDGRTVEITAFRTEGTYSDGRRPDHVEFTSSLVEDLVRRDFSINTLVVNSKGVLRDYTGGLEDIEKGLIRCVGVPAERFREDALRVLRALRFASILGFSIEDETARALKEAAPLLKNIAAERVRAELAGLLCGPFVRPVLEGYFEVFSVIIPELGEMRNFDQRNPYHKYDVWEHTVRVVEAVPPEETIRLAALFHDIGKPSSFTLDEKGIGHFYGHEAEGARIATEILIRMKCDTKTRTDVETLVRIHCVPISPDNKTIRRRLNQYGAEIVYMLIDLKIADAKAQSDLAKGRIQPLFETKEALRKCIEQNECFSIKSLAVNGRDLIACGLCEGPEIGILLEKLLQRVIRGELNNERSELLRYAASQMREQKDQRSPNMNNEG